MTQQANYESYPRNMRLAFSNKDMVHDDGSINHKYFLVKRGAYWSPREDEALIRGLEICGVGKWNKIKFYELDNYSEVEIEMRTSILLGVDTVDHLHGKKLKREDI